MVAATQLESGAQGRNAGWANTSKRKHMREGTTKTTVTSAIVRWTLK